MDSSCSDAVAGGFSVNCCPRSQQTRESQPCREESNSSAQRWVSPSVGLRWYSRENKTWREKHVSVTLWQVMFACKYVGAWSEFVFFPFWVPTFQAACCIHSFQYNMKINLQRLEDHQVLLLLCSSWCNVKFHTFTSTFSKLLFCAKWGKTCKT